MGQKSNLLTLRKKNDLNLLNLHSKDILSVNQFLILLKKLFSQRKIFLVNSTLNILGNHVELILDLFFRTIKLNNFKRKFLNLKKKNPNKNFRIHALFQLLKQINLQLKTTVIFLSTNILNNQYNKRVFLELFLKFKHFHTAIFPRRFNFFIDFLKITTLFFYGHIKLLFYIEILGQIFKILPKRRHNFFFSFIEQVFKVLIYEIKMESNVVALKTIKGVKLMLSGRIQAKPRAKFKYFQIGRIPMQSLAANIEFSKQHIYTIYGVFGLKIWLYKD